MTAIAQRETPHVGIFWVAQTSNGKARLLTAGCPLDQAEPYGDCLTYGPGHYETWAQWCRDRTVDPALRALPLPAGNFSLSSGVVTSLKEEHGNSASRIFSKDRDCLAPHVHSRRAKGSVRPCRSEMTLDVESVVGGCVS